MKEKKKKKLDLTPFEIKTSIQDPGKAFIPQNLIKALV